MSFEASAFAIFRYRVFVIVNGDSQGKNEAEVVDDAPHTLVRLVTVEVLDAARDLRLHVVHVTYPFVDARQAPAKIIHPARVDLPQTRAEQEFRVRGFPWAHHPQGLVQLQLPEGEAVLHLLDNEGLRSGPSLTFFLFLSTTHAQE